jgi:hypothetical protein
MIQITRTGVISPGAVQLEQLKDHFSRKHSVLLPRLLEPPLLDHLRRKIAAVSFITKFEFDGEAEFGKVLFVPPTEPVLFIFHFLLNNQKLFQLLETITCCPHIGNFFGRIHKSAPQEGHSIAWHGDNADHRQLGLTINLSTEDYEGGRFQLREKTSEQILFEVGPMQPGDAFVFRISPELQHRLTPVEGGGQRTVGVGWFRAQPSREIFARTFFQSF